jgi:agmatine/peptidylarginine deiminase
MKDLNDPLIFPAEWESQDAVILAWPNENTDWRPLLKEIQHTYLTLIRQITRFESVILLVPNQTVMDALHIILTDAQIDPARVIFVISSYNDTWLRDTGPLSVKIHSSARFIDFRFNGWGGKFDSSLDDQICRQLVAHPSMKAVPYQKMDIILEGGSIDTDGHGTLLTTTQCLLNKNRNPQLSREDYEQIFLQALGIKKIHWLESGHIIGDDTDGHIDMLARFCRSNTIAHCSCHDQSDPHFSSLTKMTDELKLITDLQGNNYNLVELPIPKAIVNHGGKRLPASYCNFLIINEAVLVPVYEDQMDDIACQRLAEVFKDREIIPINARTIIKQGGSLHCLTMQVPAGYIN